MERFSILVGDLTCSDAEAIVNAANPTLLGRPCWRNAGGWAAVKPVGPS